MNSVKWARQASGVARPGVFVRFSMLPCRFVLLIAVIAASSGCSASNVPADTRSPASGTAGQSVAVRDTCVVGVITIIWNGEPRYYLTTDEGETYHLQIDEETARAAGGPVSLNRQAAIVIGEVVEGVADVVRVPGIRLKEEGQSCYQ